MTEFSDLFDPPTFVSNEDSLGRSVYLLDTLKIKLPSWLKAKFPFGNELDKPQSLRSPLMNAAFKTGRTYGEGSLTELRQCLDKVLIGELKEYAERTKFYGWLDTLSEGIFDENLEKPMSKIEDTEGIERFSSGFYPFDKCVPNGFYQAIITVAANPGDGKTSMLLAAMKELAQQFEVWYFQTEIPAKLIEATLYKLEPKSWPNDGMLYCGNYSTKSILDKIKKSPNPNRIIIYDSPEIKQTAQEETVYWESVYQDLVSIKMLSKAVFVTSQIKQNINWADLGIYSLSGSASKSRFSDIIIYVSRFYETAQFKSVKERFGPIGHASVKFDYAKLQIVPDPNIDALDELF